MKYQHFINGILVSLFFLGSPAQAALPEVPEDAQAAQLWKAKREATIRELQAKAGSEMIPELGEMLRQLKTLRYRDCPERDYITEEVQSVLLAIPGHATYYGDRIAKAQAERKEAMQNAGDGGLGTADYSIKSGKFRNEESDGLKTLRYLPSPETIRVLGEFLSDEWVCPIPVQDGWTWPSLARHSAETLAVMPIIKKPNAQIEDPSNPGVLIPDLKAWQSWFEQIKAGNRTFRFEGDPTEYDLDGPAPREKIARIERDRKRDEERELRSSKGRSGFAHELEGLASSPSSVGGVVAATLGILAAVWYFLKGRKANG